MKTVVSGGPPRAFGGLFSTPLPAHRPPGGPDAAAGEADGQGLEAPPQPVLPARLPRRERQLLEHNAGASPSASRASSSTSWPSPAEAPASPASPLDARALPAPSPAAPSASFVPAGTAAAAAVGTVGAAQKADASVPVAAAGGAAEHGAAGRPHPAAEASEKTDRGKKQRDPSDYGGYCCFRESRHHRSRHEGRLDGTASQCAAIREDRPETAFHRDVVLLELRSLLRRHAVEPTDSLVADLLRWQALAQPPAAVPPHGE